MIDNHEFALIMARFDDLDKKLDEAVLGCQSTSKLVVLHDKDIHLVKGIFRGFGWLVGICMTALGLKKWIP